MYVCVYIMYINTCAHTYTHMHIYSYLMYIYRYILNKKFPLMVLCNDLRSLTKQMMSSSYDVCQHVALLMVPNYAFNVDRYYIYVSHLIF